MNKNVSLFLNIQTPTIKVYDNYVSSVSFEDVNGRIMILKNYSPTIGKINEGIIKIKDEKDNNIEYLIDKGLYVVSNNNLKILTSYCVENTKEEHEKIIDLRNKNIKLLKNNSLHNSLEIREELLILKDLVKLKNK